MGHTFTGDRGGLLCSECGAYFDDPEQDWTGKCPGSGLIALAMTGSYQSRRMAVLTAAREGRATYIPAGSEDNATALIRIDGQTVGQMSTLGHLVKVAQSGASIPGHAVNAFGVRQLLPIREG